MAMSFVRKLASGPFPYIVLGLLLPVLAYLLSAATQDSSRLNDLFLLIFGLGLLTLLLLAVILARSLFRLFRDLKQKKPGSRLTIKLVSLLVLLILSSTSIVYSFSLHFLHRGINSWFDVQVEQALDDALELSRTAFGIRMRTLLRQSRMMSEVLAELPEQEVGHNLRELIQLSGALELSIWTMKGQLLNSSMEMPGIDVPNRPNEEIFRQLQDKKDYIGLDPSDDSSLQLRAAVRIPNSSVEHEPSFLHILFPVNEHLSSLGKTVQEAYTDYKELSYLRKPLITLFTLSLSLIVLLTLLATVWFAIWISRRIIQPLQDLAKGTEAVASGDYDTQLSMPGHDEIGFLVRSFNDMTQQLTREHNATNHSHQLLDQQRAYLSAVLGSLSSGVITLNNDDLLRTTNLASNNILETNLQLDIGKSLNEIGKQHPDLDEFTQIITQQISQPSDWQQQIQIKQVAGRQTLMCRGTPLPDDAGWVIVFDDITTLLQAQRNAAWGEVARRLAHEIKNPLTPIQLSAERLQKKYLPLLPADQTDLLNKLTQTIIQQVDAMKEMVNDFSDYARNPGLQVHSQNINYLLNDVVALYQSNPNHHIQLMNKPEPLMVSIDSNRFRQVLHNLIKNAIEACEEARLAVDITINYQQITHKGADFVEIKICDHGPGIPEEMLDKLFEPYATSKTKGTGLGLAIVKKIIEEHQGVVWVETPDSGGACIIIRIPLEEQV